MTLHLTARPSPNQDERPPNQPIDFIILHYTGMKTATAALDRLCDPAAKVSAHYLVDEDGKIFHLVPEERRAWHAGISRWDNVVGLNDRSIGIEIVNPGHEWGYRPFPKVQMDAVIALLHDILQRLPMPAAHILGHSDIAPARKQDPGELFDWHLLADHGIGLWPTSLEEEVAADDAVSALARYGYDIADPAAAILAFQRHFRPHGLTGTMDEECRRILLSLLTLAGRHTT